jgi:hypothetical protein
VRYRFELAGPADDADLRRIMAATSMPGDIALTFCRAPSFFAAPGVDGFACQVVACRDTQTGRLVGFGCRSLRRQYVNGAPATIGYLSSIRLLPEYRNFGLVARGYRYFRDLHADGQTPLYLTTIAEGNEPALRILTSGRAGLPSYHPAGTLHTVALPVGRIFEPSHEPGLDIRPATNADVPTMMAFLQAQGPRRQFFPCYEGADFTSPTGALCGLQPSDILLALRGGALVGTLAGWDQHAYRQTVVHGYGGLLNWLRPVYNGWAWLSGRPRLPRPGQPLRYRTSALPVVAGDDAMVFDALLQALLRRSGAGPCDYLAIGLTDVDPLWPVVQRYRGTAYTTRIFHVCWPDGEDFRKSLDGRPMYLELGSM